MPAKDLYPPKARPLSQITLKKQVAGPNSQNKALHNVFKAHKKSNAQKKVAFKQIQAGSRMLQLEPYNTAVNRLLATKEYVPSQNQYYRDEKADPRQPEGVASTWWNHFIPSHDTLLQPNDLMINSTEIAIEWQHNKVIKLCKNYLQAWEEFAKLSPLLNTPTLYNNFTNLFKRSSAVSHVQKIVSSYLKSENQVANEDASNTYQALQAELSSLKKISSQLGWIVEQIMHELEPLTIPPSTQNDRNISLLEYAEYDKTIKQHNIPVDHVQLPALTVGGRKIQLDASELQAFRRAKGLGIAFATRLITKEADFNNLSLDKNGRMIDFGKSKYDVEFDVNEIQDLDNLWYTFANNFSITTETIDELPNQKNNPCFYWPTKGSPILELTKQTILDALDYYIDHPFEDTNILLKAIYQTLETKLQPYLNNPSNQTFLDAVNNYLTENIVTIAAYFGYHYPEKVVADKQRQIIFAHLKEFFLNFLDANTARMEQFEAAIQKMFGIEQKCFSAADVEFFKSLETNPVFIYYKNRTYLKYVLTNEAMYSALTKLYISPSRQDDINWQEKLTKDEVGRIQEIYNALSHSNQFKRFLSRYGEYALHEVMQEFITLKITKNSQLQDHPYNADFVAAIDIKEITQRYQKLCEDLNINFDVTYSPNDVARLR